MRHKSDDATRARSDEGTASAPRRPSAPSSLRALRPLFFLVATFLLLIAGFLVYLSFQPRIKGIGQGAELAPAPRLEGDRSGIINSGHGVWVKNYDQQGRLASQLRAVQYDPVGDNAVHVTRPEARFFMNDGQILRLTGREGVVITDARPGPGNKPGLGNAPDQMPQRGRLEEVQLQLFAPDQIDRLDRDLPAHATLTATMNNAVFDSDAFRIYTDDCTIDGRHVPGHQVPVVVTGDEYDFSGQGLLVRWNDRLHRLELLEIHTGEKLVIKNAARGPLTLTHSSAKPTPATRPLAIQGQANAKQVSAPQAPPTTTSPHQTASRPQPAYRATFSQNVRIFQGDQLLATAAAMQVDFMPRAQSAAPATQPAPIPATPAHSTSAPAQPSTPPAATQPAQSAQPLIVRWTGPLRVIPFTPAADEPIAPGQSAIHLAGAPVTLTSQGSTLQAASLTYHTADDSARLTGTAPNPVILTDAQGATVTTHAMLYRPRAHLAELFGAGRATGLVQSQNDENPDTLNATWSRQATIHFRPTADADRRQLDIASAHLDGDVAIEHPQLQLTSDQLNLEFSPSGEGADAPTPPSSLRQSEPASTKPSTASPQLRALLATGHVRARLQQAPEPHTAAPASPAAEQRLQADRLQLTMAASPTGQLYPHILQADGQVHAQMLQQDQQLQADHLTVTLAPTAQPATRPATPAIALKTLHATGQVQLQDPRSRADGEELQVTMTGEQPDVILTGRPARLTGENGDQLTGPRIHYSPAQQRASVQGPGQLTATQQSADGKPRPFHASWQKEINLDGSTNRITLAGQVLATSTNTDGAALTARGDTLTLLLTSAPATQPQHPNPESRIPDSNFLQNKQIHQAIFTGHASLQSLLTADDQIQRRLYLESDTIRYNLPDQRLLVPRPGRMLVEDHQPTPAGADKPRGNTAFAWEKQLTFDQTAHRAQMLGDVRIVHQPDVTGDKALPFQLRAQKVTAEFAPAKSTAPEQADLQLTRLTAQDQVNITSQGRQVDAAHIAYDPTTALLTATGQNNQPVRLQNADGSLRGWFQSLTYNLKEDQIIQMKNAQLQGHP